MRKFLVLIACAALLGGACKSDKKSDTDVASGSKGTTTAGLRSKLLTAAELPPNFTRTDVKVDDRSTDPIGCAQLDQVDAQYLKTTEHTIDASFQNGDDETATQYVQETIYAFKTEDEAKGYFTGQQTGMNACKTFSQDDGEGSTQTGLISTYAFPHVGDQSAAASLTFNGEDGTPAGGGPIVMVRKGNLWMGIVAIHVGNQPGLTGGEVEAIVRKAADKL
jgi:hypothetical protein